jgi:hypothetical protein
MYRPAEGPLMDRRHACRHPELKDLGWSWPMLVARCGNRWPWHSTGGSDRPLIPAVEERGEDSRKASLQVERMTTPVTVSFEL